MNSRILDQKTLGAVVAAAPKVTGRPEIMARQVLQMMKNEMGEFQDVTEKFIKNGEEYWTCLVGDLGGRMEDPTGHLTGAILGEMGLQKIRMGDGYHVYWNRAQVDILTDALGV